MTGLGCNRWGLGKGLIACGVAGGLLVAAVPPAQAAQSDAAIILVGFLLGGARDIGGHKPVLRTGTNKAVTRSTRPGSGMAPNSTARIDPPSRGYP